MSLLQCLHMKEYLFKFYKIRGCKYLEDSSFNYLEGILGLYKSSRPLVMYDLSILKFYTRKHTILCFHI